MRSISIAFFIGAIIFQQLSFLPDDRWSWGVIVLLPAIIYILPQSGVLKRTGLLVLIGATGFLWALFRASMFFSSGGIAAEIEGKDLLATGVVSSIPVRADRNIQFEFDVDTLRYQGQNIKPVGRVKLSWYGRAPTVRLGERWRFIIRLKRPRGFMNPGGFDYEAWLFLKGIHATGYIKAKLAAKTRDYYPEITGQVNMQLSSYQQASLIARIRQGLADDISFILKNEPSQGLIKALAIGERQDITQVQWKVLTQTGTNHLMAISGLHIGLVAGIVFYFMSWGWRMLGTIRPHGFLARCCLYIPANKFAALFALAAAFIYAALADFSIPTQRALIMVAVVMISLVLQSETRPGHILALALLAVLFVNPFANMEPGFWLSFAAVAVILFSMSARLYQQSLWWKWGRVQWVVLVGLAPFMIFVFQKAILVSPLVNFIAVPWVSMMTVPLTLAGSLLTLISEDFGAILLRWAAVSFDVLWPILSWFARLPFTQWQQHQPVSWTIIPALCGVFLLLMPQGVPARWMGIIGLLPMVLLKPAVPDEGHVRVTLLDVGQGLSAIVQTRQHVLVYDTGPKINSRFNTGSAVVVPYLRHLGITEINILLISHGDNDHIGGLHSILGEMPVNTVLTSVPERISGEEVLKCSDLQSWEWDGVRFEIVFPPPDLNTPLKSAPQRTRRLNQRLSGNNGSCVLKVSSGGGSVLLTGDIEKSAENYLLRDQQFSKGQNKLKADVLVVPHHGSNTSSTLPFIRAVDPEYSLIPVGYRNRFRLPRERIVARYKAMGARVLDTANSGAIVFFISTNDGVGKPERFRVKNRRFFNQ